MLIFSRFVFVCLRTISLLFDVSYPSFQIHREVIKKEFLKLEMLIKPRWDAEIYGNRTGYLELSLKSLTSNQLRGAI